MKMLTSNGETVVVYSTTTRYFWLTEWIRCHGLSVADFLVNFRDLVGSPQVKPAYQTETITLGDRAFVFFTKVFPDGGGQLFRASVAS